MYQQAFSPSLLAFAPPLLVSSVSFSLLCSKSHVPATFDYPTVSLQKSQHWESPSQGRRLKAMFRGWKGRRLELETHTSCLISGDPLVRLCSQWNRFKCEVLGSSLRFQKVMRLAKQPQRCTGVVRRRWSGWRVCNVGHMNWWWRKIRLCSAWTDGVVGRLWTPVRMRDGLMLCSMKILTKYSVRSDPGQLSQRRYISALQQCANRLGIFFSSSTTRSQIPTVQLGCLLSTNFRHIAGPGFPRGTCHLSVPVLLTELWQFCQWSGDALPPTYQSFPTFSPRLIRYLFVTARLELRDHSFTGQLRFRKFRRPCKHALVVGRICQTAYSATLGGFRPGRVSTSLFQTPVTWRTEPLEWELIRHSVVNHLCKHPSRSSQPLLVQQTEVSQHRRVRPLVSTLVVRSPGT